MLDEAYLLVKEFQLKSEQPCAEKPMALSDERRKIRYKWLKDELDEFKVASNTFEQVDAVVDLLYYAIGTLVEIGIKPDAIFEVVHKSNIAKLDNLVLDSDGKVLKPVGWKHPTSQIKALLDDN